MIEIETELDFDGAEYKREHDHKRLSGQIQAIYKYMLEAGWRTLSEIERDLRYPQASISAQLRNLRKARYGAFIVEKRRRGEEGQGLFEYKLIGGPSD